MQKNRFTISVSIVIELMVEYCLWKVRLITSLLIVQEVELLTTLPAFRTQKTQKMTYFLYLNRVREDSGEVFNDQSNSFARIM